MTETRTPDDGTDATSGWVYADAWILAAVGPGTRSDDLRDLVATADFLDNAVPTEAELTRALGRLLASGLLAQDGGRFVPTDAGRAVADWPARGLPGLRAGFERLRVLPLVEAAPDLPPGAAADAIRRYVAG